MQNELKKLPHTYGHMTKTWLGTKHKLCTGDDIGVLVDLNLNTLPKHNKKYGFPHN